VLLKNFTQLFLGSRERQISNVQFVAQNESLAAASTPRSAALLAEIRAGPSATGDPKQRTITR
jgi:hypothetical protein